MLVESRSLMDFALCRRWLSAAFVLGVVLMVTENAHAKEPKLTCEAERSGRHLDVSFSFENTTGEDIYVFDYFTDDGAYVLRNYDSVVLARQVLAPPLYLRQSAPKIPPITKLAAGKTLTGKLRFDWPLVENHPFQMGTKPRPVELDRVHCGFGYYPVDAKVPTMTVDIGGTSREVPSQHEALKAQRVIKSAYLDLED